MPLKDIGFTTVRVEFRKTGSGCYKIKRSCMMGCECEATLFKASRVPDAQMARDDVLCYNDQGSHGISGKGCRVLVVESGPDKWIFEIEARVCQAVA